MHNLIIAGTASAAIGMWTLAAAVSYAPLDKKEIAVARPSVVVPDMELLAQYETCSKEAESRVLTFDEATACSAHYLRLKLSFLPDMDAVAFEALPIAERWEVQKRGYAALVAWREARGGR